MEHASDSHVIAVGVTSTVRSSTTSASIDIRGIRVHGNHIGKLVIFQGIIRKATDVRPKITEAGFKCQHYEIMTYIPQTDGEFQEPRKRQGCERQGSFRVNFDQSEFIDSQKLRIQESPEGLHGGDTPVNRVRQVPYPDVGLSQTHVGG